VTSLISAFTGCPIGFAASRPRQGHGAWRFVARYRSETVAGSDGLPSIPRRDAKAWAFAFQRTGGKV